MSITLDIEEYKNYLNRNGLIQNYLSRLPTEQREFLISQMCNECFNLVCGEEDVK